MWNVSLKIKITRDAYLSHTIPPTETPSPFSTRQENCSLCEESATNTSLSSLQLDTAKQPTFEKTSHCLHPNPNDAGIDLFFRPTAQPTWGPSDSAAVALGPVQVYQQLIRVVLTTICLLLLLLTEVKSYNRPSNCLLGDVAACQAYFLL